MRALYKTQWSCWSSFNKRISSECSLAIGQTPRVCEAHVLNRKWPAANFFVRRAAAPLANEAKEFLAGGQRRRQAEAHTQAFQRETPRLADAEAPPPTLLERPRTRARCVHAAAKGFWWRSGKCKNESERRPRVLSPVLCVASARRRQQRGRRARLFARVARARNAVQFSVMQSAHRARAELLSTRARGSVKEWASEQESLP